jgi:hypothetical protein
MSVSTAACPVTSSGLFWDAKCGRTSPNVRLVLVEKSGSVSPAAPAASANSVQAPPDCRAADTPVVFSLR